MAATAEGLSAAFDGLQLFLGMVSLRCARPHPSRPPRGLPRSRRPRGLAHGRHHRYSGLESHRKRGKSRDLTGYDAGKKVKGIKRNALTDTIGLLLGIEVIPACVQDRDGAADLIKKTRRLFPFVSRVFADGGYSGDKLVTDLASQRVTLEIVKRTDKEGGFKLIRRRWVIERTFAWFGRNRRLAKDFENLTRIALAFVKLASIRFMLRRLCNPL